METEPILTSNTLNTCQLLHTRAACAVCGAPAIGRNFDAMTCLSCKAFFRRNAYNEHLIYTCRVSNSCEITMTTRRYCSACRLKKCFKQGMKKELIRSLSAINHASSLAASHKSRHATTSIATLDLLSHRDRSTLSLDDWNLLTNIRNSYEDYCVQPFLESHKLVPLIPPKQPYRSRLKLQRLIDLRYKYMSVIASFVRRVLQYDRYSLSIEHDNAYAKENLSCLITPNTCELMKAKVLEWVPWEHDRLALESVLSEEILERLGEVLSTFQHLVPQDPMIIKLFVVILTLSPGIVPLMKKDVYEYADFQALSKTFLSRQNFYITLLWKYVQHRLGYEAAVMFSVRFVQNFLRRQAIEADMIQLVQHRQDLAQMIQLIESSMNL